MNTTPTPSVIPDNVSNPNVNFSVSYKVLKPGDGYDFISCTLVMLFITVPENPHLSAGQIISSGASDLAACETQCYQIIRKVVSKSFQDLRCPNSKTCIVISTNPVFISNIVTKTFSENPGNQNFAAQRINLQQKCETISNLTIVSRFSLKDVAMKTSLKQFSGSCPSAWTKKTGNNQQCTQSKCSGSEDCFFFGNKCDNGCGSGALGFLIPDQTIFWNFGPSCCHHDHCYVTTRSQAEYDIMFLSSMVQECLSKYTSEILQDLCSLDAYVYVKL